MARCQQHWELCATANGVDIPQQGLSWLTLTLDQWKHGPVARGKRHGGITGQEELSFLLHSGVTLSKHIHYERNPCVAPLED